MKNIFFRSPFFLSITVLLMVACQKQTIKPVHDSRAAQKGTAAERMAFEFQGRGLADSAFLYFSEARKHYEKANDSARIVYELLNMGAIQYQYNDFAEMQVTMVEALKYLDKKSAVTYKPIIYNNLGMAYCQLEDYGRAIESYRKTLSLSTLPVYRLTAQNNIGYAYISGKNYRKGFELLHEVSQSPHIGDSLSVKARVTDNLGYCAYKLGRHEGIGLMLEGAAIRKKIGDRFGQVTSNLHLGEALLNDDNEKAKAFVREAARLSALTNSPDDRLLALDFLTTNGNLSEARRYATQYFRISDSLQSVRRKARNYFAEVKYDYKRERDEKLKSQANEAHLKLRQSELENQRLVWLIAAICTIFAGSIIIYLITLRNKRNRWKASYEAEVRMANRMHGELANDLHQTIVYTETSDLSKPESRNRLLDNLDLIYRRARNISRENAAIGNDNFAGTLKDIIAYYGNPGQNVLAKGINDVDWHSLSEQQKVVVHRTIQELLVNMKKHSRCSLAVIQFNTDGKQFGIAYSDNGIGTSGFAEPKNGLAIMENRIGDLKGTITFGDGGKGFRVNIAFPI